MMEEMDESWRGKTILRRAGREGGREGGEEGFMVNVYR